MNSKRGRVLKTLWYTVGHHPGAGERPGRKPSMEAKGTLGRAGWIAALGPVVLICGTASAEFIPNLSIVVGNDPPVFAEADNPFQIVLNDYQSSSIAGLHVNNLLIDFRVHDRDGFVLASTSSTVAPGANFWFEPPGGETVPIEFDITITADVSGLFPNTLGPYRTNTHLLGDYVEVVPETNGEIRPSGTITHARSEFAGYTLSFTTLERNGEEPDWLSMGHVDGGLVQDQSAGEDGLLRFAPPDMSNYAMMEPLQVRHVQSIQLGPNAGVISPVSATFSMTLIPEPTTMMLLLLAAPALIRRPRRRRPDPAC